jgi:hypothetical protein
LIVCDFRLELVFIKCSIRTLKKSLA